MDYPLHLIVKKLKARRAVIAKKKEVYYISSHRKLPLDVDVLHPLIAKFD